MPEFVRTAYILTRVAQVLGHDHVFVIHKNLFAVLVCCADLRLHELTISRLPMNENKKHFIALRFE
jgi:hypothetical protein